MSSAVAFKRVLHYGFINSCNIAPYRFKYMSNVARALDEAKEKLPPPHDNERKSKKRTSETDSILRKFENYQAEPLSAVNFQWRGALEGEHLDPTVHLELEPPCQIKDLKFCDIKYPFSPDQQKVVGHLAYTRPFRVLSDKGVRLARKSISENMKVLGHQDERASCYLRGLGMVSNFHSDLAYSPELLALLSSLSRDSVAPHTTPMNISHTNVGEIGTGRPVDKWHVDSTDYVLVIVLSDQTDMVGGDLRVLQLPDASNTDSNLTVFETLQEQGVPEELVETVSYAKAGYGIFMQGSKILHQVSEVLQAREPRISLVNSYQSNRVFIQPDKTRFSSYERFDGYEIAAVDYARHKAWRIGSQLKFIKDYASYNNEMANPEDLSAILRNASEELELAADLLDKKVTDSPKWVEG